MAGSVTVLTDANFDAEVKNAGKPVVIDFWATWCGPCIRMAPIFEQLSVEYAGAVKFTKVDVDENPGIAAAFGVNAMPTFILYNKGAEANRRIGAMSKSDLKTLIDSSVK